MKIRITLYNLIAFCMTMTLSYAKLPTLKPDSTWEIFGQHNKKSKFNTIFLKNPSSTAKNKYEIFDMNEITLVKIEEYLEKIAKSNTKEIPQILSSKSPDNKAIHMSFTVLKGNTSKLLLHSDDGVSVFVTRRPDYRKDKIKTPSKIDKPIWSRFGKGQALPNIFGDRNVFTGKKDGSKRKKLQSAYIMPYEFICGKKESVVYDVFIFFSNTHWGGEEIDYDGFSAFLLEYNKRVKLNITANKDMQGGVTDGGVDEVDEDSFVKPVIIDVNNNDDDGDEKPDCIDSEITDADIKSIAGGGLIGHPHGLLYATVNPLDLVDGNKVILSILPKNSSDVSQAKKCLRIFDKKTKEVLVEPGSPKTLKKDITSYFKGRNRIELIMEGITYGDPLVQLSLVDKNDELIGTKDLSVDQLRVEVNVDQYWNDEEKKPEGIKTTSKGGKAIYIGTEQILMYDDGYKKIKKGAVAVRATISGMNPPSSWKNIGGKLEMRHKQTNSFWVGLDTTKNRKVGWIQGGILAEREGDSGGWKDKGLYFYVETGYYDEAVGKWRSNKKAVAIANAKIASEALYGELIVFKVEHGAAMFLKMPDLIRKGPDFSIIVKGETVALTRVGFWSPADNLTPSQQRGIERFKNEKFERIQARAELPSSIAASQGTSSRPALITNIKVAHQKQGHNLKATYENLDTKMFVWENLLFENASNILINTKKKPSVHYHWGTKISKDKKSLFVWDKRDWLFSKKALNGYNDKNNPIPLAIYLSEYRNWTKKGKTVSARLMAMGGTIDKPIVINEGRIRLAIKVNNNITRVYEYKLADFSKENQEFVNNL